MQVFIHKGRVHIIPKPRSPAEIGLLPVTTPIISEAIELVENENINTKCSSKVQESIDNRLAWYACCCCCCCCCCLRGKFSFTQGSRVNWPVTFLWKVLVVLHLKSGRTLMIARPDSRNRITIARQSCPSIN